MIRVWPGRPYPLGATYDGVGTNFAVFSEAAERNEQESTWQSYRKPKPKGQS